ncbi:MAG TPA: RNase adapter RapZ [Ruminococcaceae bacterium]|nr:RNase adapter RapZ [Oscillospiraceae bacterium]
MEFVIITGMSGAGKTTALHVMEDIGYYCVDNIPSSLLPTLYELCSKAEDKMMKKAAVVVDVRGNLNYNEMNSHIEDFKMAHSDVKILFIDAKSDQIIVRYKETRRKHPLADRLKDGSVVDAVEFEKALMLPVKRISDYLVDTTYMSNRQIRERITAMFMGDSSLGITLTFVSFGFKYGIPPESDIILDVRCLPNPFYIAELKYKTGLDGEVRDYVLNSENTREFLSRIESFLDFSVPLYSKEGKSELVVAVGCTGGKHRSVTLAGMLDDHFQKLGYRCVLQHRDVTKN